MRRRGEAIEYLLVALGVIAALGLVTWCFVAGPCKSGEHEKETVFVVPEGMIYAYGTGVAKSIDDAEKIAKDRALSELSKQIYVEMTSSATLVNVAISHTSDRVKSMAAIAYEEVVRSESSLEIAGYVWKVLKRKKTAEGYRIEGVAMVEREKALLYLQIYVATKMAQKFLENDMIFSARRVMDTFREISKRSDLPPQITGRFTETVSKLMERWKGIDGLLKELDSRSPDTPSEILSYLEMVEKLKRSAADVPPELLEKYKERIRGKLTVSVNISGPEEVVLGQIVDLEIFLKPKVSGIHTFHVESKEGDFPKEVSIEDGEGTLSGEVEGEDVRVEINLADVLVDRWSPGAVFSKSLKNMVKVAVKMILPLAPKQFVIPEIWKEPNGELAFHANDYLVEEGVGVDVESLVEDFEKIDSKWYEDLKLPENVELLRVEIEGNELTLKGGKGVSVKVRGIEYETKPMSKEDKVLFYRALIASGHPEAVPKDLTGDPEIDYLVAVSYYFMGNLGKAAEILENMKNSYPKSYVTLSRIYHDMGDYEKSIKTGIDYAELGMTEGTDQVYRIMASSFADVKDVNTLVVYLRWLYKIVKTVKDCDSGYYAVAVLLRKLENPKEALGWILKALDIKKDPLYLLEYVRVLKDLGKIDKAKEVLKELESMELSPSLEVEVESLAEEIGE